MKNIFLAVVIIITLAGCEKTVLLDVRQTESKIVIEGLVSDRPGYQFVKVSRTGSFYDKGLSPRITDAIVSVEDDLGNVFPFEHNPNDKSDSVGFYFPSTPFIGEIGRTYKLTVVSGGQTYQAQDKIIRLVPIEKLTYRTNDNEFDDPRDPGRFYELLLFVKEPQDTRDYYFFRTIRNGNREYGFPGEIYVADDEFIGEKIDGVSLPVFYAENDHAKVEVFSLTREAFIYYRDLSKLLANDGGMFGTPPANPRSNISNDAMGFFQASAIQSSEIIIGQ